jgi:hypothetical protein
MVLQGTVGKLTQDAVSRVLFYFLRHQRRKFTGIVMGRIPEVGIVRPAGSHIHFPVPAGYSRVTQQGYRLPFLSPVVRGQQGAGVTLGQQRAYRPGLSLPPRVALKQGKTSGTVDPHRPAAGHQNQGSSRRKLFQISPVQLDKPVPGAPCSTQAVVVVQLPVIPGENKTVHHLHPLPRISYTTIIMHILEHDKGFGFLGDIPSGTFL